MRTLDPKEEPTSAIVAAPTGEGADRTGSPSHSPDGVDLTLVRWMLSLTHAERLQVLQVGSRSLHGLLGAAAHR